MYLIAPTFPGPRQTKTNARVASFPNDSTVLPVVCTRWRWNSFIGTVTFGAVDIGCKWAWVTVTRIIIQRSARYMKQEIMINPTFCLTKKCYPDAKAAYWKFAYTPLPLNPSPPEQTMIMQPIKWGIYLNFISAKAIEFLALFNCLETRKFWYII